MAEEDILQAKDLPTFHGRDYKPGAAYDSNIVCDYAHDTRCDGSCLPWNNEWLQGDLYPHAMICFPTFDLVYGNCSLDRTMYENCAIQQPRDSYRTRNKSTADFYTNQRRPLFARKGRGCWSKKYLRRSNFNVILRSRILATQRRSPRPSIKYMSPGERFINLVL
jgi:hypothetical protein